jgi:hypothetical protein
MRIYLAGNLPQLKTKGREKAVLEKMIKIGPYRRLMSFYFLNRWKDENIIRDISRRLL